jgi:DNA-binding beta-propeller fold protein YncE
MTTIDAPPAAPETVLPLPPDESGSISELSDKEKKKRRRKIALLLILLLIFAALFAWYLFNRKPLSELPGLSQAKVPHYEFSIYGTNHPLGVAVSPTGDHIYVTESDGARVVRVYDRSGKQTGTLKPPASTGPTHLPIYVAINPTTKDVYVSDRTTGSIYVYNDKGSYLRTFAAKGNPVGNWAPLGLAFGPKGNLFVTDVGGPTPKTHRVLEFGPDGTLLRSLGTAGQFSFPNGLAVDPRGNVDVSDSNNGRLVVLDPAGSVRATINRGIGEGDVGLPRGAATDSGRLYVVDTVDHMVRVYSVGTAKAETPKYLASFGGEGQVDGRFEYPNGVATDARAHVYVTDRENNRVQVWGY